MAAFSPYLNTAIDGDFGASSPIFQGYNRWRGSGARQKKGGIKAGRRRRGRGGKGESKKLNKGSDC